jgi:hypothetical protein
VNLELLAPQAEYRELEKQWNDLLQNGQKDAQTGTVITLPIEDAKKRLLEQTAGTAQQSGTPPAPAAEPNTLTRSRQLVSDSSAGREATITIR